MATKTKTSETPDSAPAHSVEQVFSEALGHLDAGDLSAAVRAFTLVEEGAVAQDRLSLCRAARSYLAAIRARQEQGEASRPAPELAVQLHLNRRDLDEALAKAGEALAAQPDRASLHYLKALAYALQGSAQESAEALARAIELEPGLLFQFRLEPDFDGVRHSGPFAALNR
jgi:tetratricopeptide (TPR) repeat protein